MNWFHKLFGRGKQGLPSQGEEKRDVPEIPDATDAQTPSEQLPDDEREMSVISSSVSPKVWEMYAQIGEQAAKSGAFLSEARTVSVAILLDATGSMGPVIEMAKNEIRHILRRLGEEGVQAEIQMFGYRDYMDRQILECMARTRDAKLLEQWLQSLRAAGGGGNSGEAVEIALSALFSAMPDVVILAGNEPSNDADTIRQYRAGQETAQALSLQFGERGCPIHTFIVKYDDPSMERLTEADFTEIARRSGGQTGKLDGSEAMRNMAVMAILSKARGIGAISRYMKKHQSELSSSSQAFAGKLLESGKSKGK